MKQENILCRRKWLKWILYSLLFFFIVIVAAFPFIYREMQNYVRRIACASNMMSLGLVMQQYAMDFNDCFPDKNGAAGLDILRSEEYCSDPKIYICPASGMVASGFNQPLVSSYEYRGGLKATPENAAKVLMWDKCGNHKNCCNVLFGDGHVETIGLKNGRIIREFFYKGKIPNPYQPVAADISELPPEIIHAVGGIVYP